MDILEDGYIKATISNIPKWGEHIIDNYLSVTAASGTDGSDRINLKQSLRIQFDNVQIKNTTELCNIKSCAFVENATEEHFFSVEISFNNKSEAIISSTCDLCINKSNLLQPCMHIVKFILWLDKKATESHPNNFTLWDLLRKGKTQSALKVKDLFLKDEIRSQVEMEAENITDEDGDIFVKSLLDEMEKSGLQNSAIYKHRRQVFDEFEAIYIHHAMLANAHRYINDMQIFNDNMEEAARNSLFERLSEASIDNYKKPFWFEVQFGRIRCSLMHNIAIRKDSTDDESILKSIFCEDRGWNVDERCQLKEHKRFILKQTEKLEDKVYRECGLLLHESYPYLCASPDGITDDHIVEIKAPKTDEEFEKYLEGKETISPKYMAQIQIQMYMANVTKALYCVLSPTFETNGALHYVWVQADLEFVASLLNTAEDYWKDILFPKLCNIYINSK